MSAFHQRQDATRNDGTVSRRWQFEDALEPDHPISTQSLPVDGTLGPSLWQAVRDRVQVSAALRQASGTGRASRMHSEVRIDAEGLSTDTIGSHNSGSSRPGQHAGHWQSLAHLFDQDGPEPVAREARSRRKRASSSNRQDSPEARRTSQHTPTPSRRNQGGTMTSDDRPQSQASISPQRGRNSIARASDDGRGASGVSPGPERRKTIMAWNRMVSPPPSRQHGGGVEDRSRLSNMTSLSEEPDSWLHNDPDDAPEGEDPLLYTTQETLLDSDTESTVSDTESEANIGVRPGSGSLAVIAEHGGPAAGDTVDRAHTLRGRLGRYSAGLRRRMQLSPLQRGIAKCGIAYLIASLFTFSPLLSSNMAKLLPNHDPDARVPFSNLHMIATVAVYFHPAKTLGAMVEADFFALIAFVFSVALGFSSMAVAVFLHDADMLFVSDILSVLVFLGIGMALVGYAKVKVAKPQFNTACSLVSIIVFTVVVKEGSKHLGHFSFDKTIQVTLVVIAGSLVSNLVCFLFWPQSATTNLQNDIDKNLQGFATLLRVLTKTFLLDDPSNFHFKSDKIKKAIDDHHESFTSLKKDLGEAMLERFFDLRLRGKTSYYKDATSSMNRLAQHLAGLRSSCGLQHQIMMARVQARKAREAQEHPEAEAAASFSGTATRGQSADVAEALANLKEGERGAGASSRDAEQSADAGQRARAFEDFIDSVGPHMRSLVFTCSRTLRNLRTTFVAQRGRSLGDMAKPEAAAAASMQDGRDTEPLLGSRFRTGDSFDILARDVSSALKRFQHEQTVAIKRIYTMEPKKAEAEREAAEHASKQTSPHGAGDRLPASLLSRAHPDEEIFLIFFFVFNLEEFAKELEVLVEALEMLRQGEERLATARATSIWSPIKLYLATMLPCWRSLLGRKKTRGLSAAAARRGPVRRKTEDVLDFPSNRRNTVNTAQTPVALTFKQRFQRLVWSIGEFLREADTKFAIKAGAGSAILASPAFFESTRPTFKKFQMQWALVSFMVVLSPTLGQSNQMSLHRFLGTILGAAAAVGIYSLFPDDNVALPIFGLFFSLPCFNYIVGRPQLASSGRFVLLTYNLTALYSYNLRKVGIEVEQIAFQRTVSVLVGVLWATVLNQLVWPFEARRELARGVSDLIFKLAWLYQRLVVTYSEDQYKAANVVSVDEAHDDEDENSAYADDVERQPLLRSRQTPIIDEFQTIELHLQVTIIKLEGLLAQTKHEPRLKGPFPVATYKAMLGCCQNILDKLHSMRCVTSRDDWYQQVRRDFVIPVNPERREMVGNVLLFFYTLGSAFHLKIPVPPYFPPASGCRLRLLEKIRELPVVKRRAVRGSSAYLLFYSYALAMGDVIEQLEELGRLTQHNFGVWGGSTANFERHFQTSPESADPTPYGTVRGPRQRS
ncbi:uncharacterized protein PFL1_05886 [Pseudozyma flocculosa PF-1]|uniref:Uncharacterized protein n=1 Tax=Pseudozyma flocculosa PF-1 TaxID=1277687 RepID=A0A061H2T3_9BASI|nr:uncharacterized protein PFL1_05886 [Pseudozyma flocculosa PF-1]EPQ26564.1 hypothetical protein PFL1_05886 [Pseudozyma flocculosa PF-1]